MMRELHELIEFHFSGFRDCKCESSSAAVSVLEVGVWPVIYPRLLAGGCKSGGNRDIKREIEEMKLRLDLGLFI